MEITTCEQLVLAELEAAQNASERLSQENERLRAQVEALEADREPSRLDAYIYALGRKQAFNEFTGYPGNVTDKDGELVPFDVWCEDFIRDYTLPKWLSQAECVRQFEPEFRKAYEDAVAEERE